MLLRRLVSLPAPIALLCGVALLAGCSCSPQTQANNPTENSIDPSVQADEARKAAESQCISKAFNEAVLSPQNVKATLDSMMAQPLDGCPTDFASGFVKLRTAVRDYAQTLAQIEANNKQQDTAVGLDALNLACSVFSGEQCAKSSIQGWVDADQSLKAEDAANRAAVQSAYDELEAVAAQHGVYIHNTPVSPSPTPTPDATGTVQ